MYMLTRREKYGPRCMWSSSTHHRGCGSSCLSICKTQGTSYDLVDLLARLPSTVGAYLESVLVSYELSRHEASQIQSANRRCVDIVILLVAVSTSAPEGRLMPSWHTAWSILWPS